MIFTTTPFCALVGFLYFYTLYLASGGTELGIFLSLDSLTGPLLAVLWERRHSEGLE